MRSLFLFLTLGFTAFAGREGNFIIRFEPKVVLQPEVQIPFEIKVMNNRQEPLHEAQVTLHIETKDHKRLQVFKAPEVTEGVYLAKPIFSQAGDWNISVEVHRNDQETSRTREYTIPVVK